MKGPVVKVVDDERFFVCEYTGALIQMRFAIPGEGRCFCSLPVILRWILQTRSADLQIIKALLQEHYHQPDIPIQPPLTARPPLTDDQLLTYLECLPMGVAWLRIEGGEYIDDFNEEERAE